MSGSATKQEPEDDPELKYAEEDERLEKLLEAHANKLSEHFDSVRIVAVVNRGDGVYARISRGDGNYWSQYGSVKDWLIEQEQETRNRAGE